MARIFPLVFLFLLVLFESVPHVSEEIVNHNVPFKCYHKLIKQIINLIETREWVGVAGGWWAGTPTTAKQTRRARTIKISWNHKKSLMRCNGTAYGPFDWRYIKSCFQVVNFSKAFEFASRGGGRGFRARLTSGFMRRGPSTGWCGSNMLRLS